MPWFKRRKPELYLAESFTQLSSQPARQVRAPEERAPEVCVFCGAHGPGAALIELTDYAYSKPHGLCCARCRDAFARFEERVRHLTRAGHSPWILPDGDTARPLSSGPDQLGAVRAALGGLEGRFHCVPRAAARIAALRLGVYAAEADEPAVASKAEAVGSVARAVARNLARNHEELVKYHGGKEYRAYSVALFGDGRGVLFQETGTDGSWLRQHCFLVDSDFGVHRYRFYDR